MDPFHAGQELIWATAACGQHLDGPQAQDVFLLRVVVKEEGSDRSDRSLSCAQIAADHGRLYW